MKKWEDLPIEMRTDAVRPYYEALANKRIELCFKWIFDFVVSSVMLVVLSPVFLVLAIAIKLDSPGPVFFRQTRVTAYGEMFKIFKFRTMVRDAEKSGVLVTAKGDCRITRVGQLIRPFRLDELPQLLDVVRGKMTFVGVRPEAVKYVEHYTSEMKATLLLPAGITSLASIYYKDEDQLLAGAADTELLYMEKVLPGKMYWNLKGLKDFSFWSDIRLIFMTLLAVLGRNYLANTPIISPSEGARADENAELLKNGISENYWRKNEI
jgi:lipopolysaccharide/colanic/teichoic acid biosynthesis glycosyltransferase